ncbi:sensor histidine kinase [Sulfurimonas sp.]
MFRNLRLNIFIYYFVTVITFLIGLYYFVKILEVENIVLLAIIIVCFVILSGIFISKLAVDPLFEYVKNLQNLSKETLHELNLPISTITTNTQMLKRNTEDAKVLKRVGRIESACEMLQQRYNELDYLIKMQSKQTIKEKFAVDELLHDRIDFLQKIYPHMNFSKSLSALEIQSDKTGLCKVIDNIIDNAVKYSGESKNIDITLENNTIYIRDYGIGMDEVEVIHIFDTYYQTNENMQGFGIGLSMVKRFCDKNNIDLSFDTEPGSGTTVQLKFKNI